MQIKFDPCHILVFSESKVTCRILAIFLLRKNEKWEIVLQSILFQQGDIVELGEEGEEKVD